jgi:hypothetical protein
MTIIHRDVRLNHLRTLVYLCGADGRDELPEMELIAHDVKGVQFSRRFEESAASRLVQCRVRNQADVEMKRVKCQSITNHLYWQRVS